MKKVFWIVAFSILPSMVNSADLFGTSPNLNFYGSPPQRWMGCFLGANLGAGWQNSEVSFDGATYGINSGAGVFGGGQVGCDYQVNKWVLGLQGLFDGASMNASRTLNIDTFGSETLNTEARWTATLTGRLGYSFNPDFLVYVRGGAAWVHNNYNVSGAYTGSGAPESGDPFSVNDSATAPGWVVGGGLEKALDDKWSIFGEYNYMDFSTMNVTYSGNYPSCDKDCGPWTDPWNHRIQAVLFGVNYHF